MSLASELETEEPYISLTAVLFSLGENYGNIKTLARLDKARKVFLTHALLQSDLSAGDRRELLDWLKEFENKFFAYIRAKNLPPENPLLDDDRLRYFLWLVTRGSLGHEKAVQSLLPFCYKRLSAELRGRRQQKRQKESAAANVDDLPYRMAIFIRFFPEERLLSRYAIRGGIKRNDVDRAVEEYWKTDSGPSERKTIEEYRRQISDTLQIKNDDSSRRNFVEIDAGLKQQLGFAPNSKIVVENTEEEFSASGGLILFDDDENSDFEHDYERAQKIAFGSYRASPLAPRAAGRLTTHDVRLLLPGEIGRLARLLDNLSREPENNWKCLLLWSMLVTGLPLKRLLNLRWASPKSDWQEMAQAAREKEESPLFLLPEGIILAASTADINVAAGSDISHIYRPRADFVPLSLGIIGSKYAAAVYESFRKNLPVFVFPKSPVKPLTQDNLSNFLEFFSHQAAAGKLSLSWSRLTATIRPYCIEAGLTPLVSALGSGRPPRSHKTILSYVAYDCRQFFLDHSQVVRAIEAVAYGGGEMEIKTADLLAANIFDSEKIPVLNELEGKNLGAAYAPRVSKVKGAWRAICAADERLRERGGDWCERLNAATLRAVFALMITTGIREQEIKNIAREKLDLPSKLARLVGKSTAYLRESREIPLIDKTTDELNRYLAVIRELPVDCRSTSTVPLFWCCSPEGSVTPLPSGGADWLASSVPLDEPILFSLRTLRHALRTELHAAKANFAAANEIFGHVTADETVTHRLSGGRLPDIYRSFCAANEKIAANLLE